MPSTRARSAILRTSKGDVHGGSGLSIIVVDCASARAPKDWPKYECAVYVYSRSHTRCLCEMRCEDCCSGTFTDCLDDFAYTHFEEVFDSEVALLDCLNFSRLVTTIASCSGAKNGGFFGTLDRREPILQLRMDERAADSLFGGPDDGHDFFTSLDGANTSPKQSVQEPAVHYSESVPVDSYAAVPYLSAPPSTAQANHSPDPYAQAASHAQAASSQDPYAPPHAAHSATAYQPTSGIPSQPAATPYTPKTTPGM